MNNTFFAAPDLASAHSAQASTDYASAMIVHPESTVFNYSDFLNAAYGSTQAPIPVFLDGQEHAVSDPVFFAEHAGKLRVSPLTEDGMAFFFGVLEDAAEDSYTECRVKPTAALFKDGTTIVVWALDCPATTAEAQPIADALGMDALDECIPLPGTDGWTLVYVDADIYCTLQDLAGAYGAQVAPTHTEVLGKFGDANILTPFDPADERYAQEMIITGGGGAESKNWKPLAMTIATALGHLSEHREGKKDGPAFVLGDMVPGRRLKNAVKTLYAVGLDIDTGTPSAVINEALKKLGCAAISYSTHSHGKTRTEFKKDMLLKFAPGEEISDDLIKRYLVFKEWDASIVESAVYIGTDHTDKGIMVTVEHMPMPKTRIVIPFKTPFDIAKEGVTQADAMAKWAKVPEAVAVLLGVPFDKSCTDPSRLYYFGRHAKNRPFEVNIFGGELFDWQTLALNDPLDRLAAEVNKGTSKSKTQGGRDLGRWSMKAGHGFQIADVLEEHCPDRIRGKAATVGVEIECPFDENHNNAGDPNDRACFAVNAGDGSHDWFTISCQHESCRDKTMLDMLGKMVTDGWFDRSVLDDEKYNAVAPEDAPQPEVANRIQKEDKAKKDYKEAINGLAPDSAPDAIDKVAKVVNAANLSAVSLQRAIDTMAKKLNVKPAVIKTTLKEARKFAVGVMTDKSGRVTFAYKGEYDFDDACDVCSTALLDRNKRDKQPTFSQISGNAVRLDIRDGRANFVEMDQTSLWSELSNLVSFVPYNENGARARQPVDRNVATHVFEQAYRTMPPAPEVIYTPIYLKNGSLLLDGKYHFDPANDVNYLLMLNDLKVPKVPLRPTKADMEESLKWIRDELFSDFPFLDTDLSGIERREPAEANALAMIVTPFMRRTIQGRTPVFFVKKPQAGTGGTLLASLPIHLFDGVTGEGANMSYTSNEEEMEKRLVAAIMGTRTHLFFDDVKEFNNRVLLRNITSPCVAGRVLGHSRNFERPNNYNWVASGNNPNIGEEMRRRICWIRLNAKTADVAGRKYRHPDTSGMQFSEFVERNRGTAIRHILTLVEYWRGCGAKEFTERRLSGFDDWSKKVGGVLAACGVEGFLDNHAPVALDMEQSSENEFLRLWLAKHGIAFWGVKDLYNWVSSADLSVMNGRTDEEKRRNFERTLRGLEGRAFEVDKKTYVVRAKQDENKATTFGIEYVEQNA